MEQFKWFEGEWAERQKINEAARELNALGAVQNGLAAQVHRLFALDKDQGKELERLRMTIAVLMDVLVEAGVTEDAKLRERLDLALSTLEPKPAPVTSPAGEARSVRCAACGNEVAASFTYVTSRGEVCDRCFDSA